MREMVPDVDSQLGKFINSRFEEPPATESVPEIQVFRYQKPVLRPGKKRAGVRLVNTDIITAFVQVFEHGGEAVMHSHGGMDGFWLVLSGTARFYTGDGKVVTVGAMEGVCTPRNMKYWFERVGDVPLEILQVDAIHPGLKNTYSADPGTETAEKTERGLLAFFDAKEE